MTHRSGSQNLNLTDCFFFVTKRADNANANAKPPPSNSCQIISHCNIYFRYKLDRSDFCFGPCQIAVQFIVAGSVSLVSKAPCTSRILNFKVTGFLSTVGLCVFVCITVLAVCDAQKHTHKHTTTSSCSRRGCFAVTFQGWEGRKRSHAPKIWSRDS